LSIRRPASLGNQVEVRNTEITGNTSNDPRALAADRAPHH
jgi:hypothetical protein